MALKRLGQAIASLSADLRRDIYIFIAAIVFLSVVYFLALFAEPWLN
jgi:VanZ family protein